jgi:hypothetical protein
MCLDFARLVPYTVFTSSLHLFCRRSPEASLFGCRPPLQPIYTPSPRGSPRHEWWPKRKAEPRKVGSVALRWRATSVRGASFHGKHQPRRDARPNSPALEAGKSFEGQSYGGRSAGDWASRLLSVSCAEHLRVGTGACSYQGRITIQGWGTATMTNKANRTTSANKNVGLRQHRRWQGGLSPSRGLFHKAIHKAEQAHGNHNRTYSKRHCNQVYQHEVSISEAKVTDSVSWPL